MVFTDIIELCSFVVKIKKIYTIYYYLFIYYMKNKNYNKNLIVTD